MTCYVSSGTLNSTNSTHLCAGMGWALQMLHSIKLCYNVTTAVGMGDCIMQSQNGHYVW